LLWLWGGKERSAMRREESRKVVSILVERTGRRGVVWV